MAINKTPVFINLLRFVNIFGASTFYRSKNSLYFDTPVRKIMAVVSGGLIILLAFFSAVGSANGKYISAPSMISYNDHKKTAFLISRKTGTLLFIIIELLQCENIFFFKFTKGYVL